MRLATRMGAPLMSTMRASMPCLAKRPCSCAMSSGIVRGLIAATPMVILVWASVGMPSRAIIREAAIQTISQNLPAIFVLLRSAVAENVANIRYWKRQQDYSYEKRCPGVKSFYGAWID